MPFVDLEQGSTPEPEIIPAGVTVPVNNRLALTTREVHGTLLTMKARKYASYMTAYSNILTRKSLVGHSK